jgi:hypothetical protein
MSRHNKVNPDHYKTGGRLSPDDLAREQQKQRVAGARTPAQRGKAATRKPSSGTAAVPSGQRRGARTEDEER